MAFLHGDLVLTIVSATGLPQGESYHLGGLGRKLASLAKDYNDPYVNVLIDEEKIITTTALDNAKEPVWNETFTVPMCQNVEKLDFEVKDKDIVGSTPLATGSLAIQELVQAPGMVLDKTLSLMAVKKKKQMGSLTLRLRFLPCSSAPANPEVPDIYFKATPGNRVVFYQDAHNEPGTFPAVPLPDGSYYQVRGAWQDIYSAIEEARDFVFATGWSFHPEIRLVRPDGPTLGELLLNKARQGVKVCIMVWDDRTSNVLGQGVMGTHDEAMRNYFKGSAVKCALVGRSGGRHNSVMEGQTASTFFSHHQKSVMCDADPLPGSSSRRAVAFVGGLDLTKGRYDTAEHSLFRTYHTLHKDDYQNASFDCKEGWGPREPWEDIHCKLDGLAAHQVIRNFTERWAKQADPDQPLNFALPDADQQVSEDPAAFSVQVMRSIDARSAVFEAGNNKLFLKKGRAVDRSIQLGYIHQIRRAQDFIFIENQYFLGASFNWTEQSNSGCSHPIPAEITQKIVNKIYAGERFAAYIIQPLFPEGPPADGSMQAILRFQKLTAESMYTRIANAINARKAQFPDFDAVPTDYLNFYCLGNRETTEGWTLPSAPQPAETEACFNSSRSRRFMIYVHSKLMITDDEHAIIGSANVNMRSMAGTRDTEIAAGIWQPLHACQGPGATPRGQVHAFRMSLWAEHLCGKGGALEQCFWAPSSVECVRRVNELAQANWQKWIGEEVVEMDGHLMCYPITVDPRTGLVTEREDTNMVVPDFPNAPLFGAQSNIAAGMGLPYTLTT